MSIVLASASPRRRELLDQIGVRYDVYPVDVDESPQPGEAAEDLVVRLACLKAETGWQQTGRNRTVLGSDTLGVQGDEILTKPRDFEHASAMLRRMSGQWHDIFSAVAVCHQGKTRWGLNRNRVLFRDISDDEIRRYWASGEPQDKAGAYAIQGVGAVFVKEIRGSYSGIMGLPLQETWQILDELNIEKSL